ncbi:hypothetical protein [Nocardia wallacei]|uniref:hypothetical protein n=1 Tax=Nocardia wallacei TaxID=480035 RepID=UPI002453B3B9|nr:hypothetical protein [Nocardia wallacei]
MLKYVVGAIAAMVLFLGFGPTTATAQPVPSSLTQTATEVSMPPGDTVEVRTGLGAGIGAVLGGLAGLPFFVSEQSPAR